MRGALVEHVHTYVLRNAAAVDAPDMLGAQHQPQFSGEIVGVQKLCFFSFPIAVQGSWLRGSTQTQTPRQPEPVLSPAQRRCEETLPRLQCACSKKALFRLCAVLCVPLTPITRGKCAPKYTGKPELAKSSPASLLTGPLPALHAAVVPQAPPVLMEPIPKPLTKGKAKRQRTERKEKFTDEGDDSDESESDDDGDEDKHQENDEGGESDNEEESDEQSDDKESAGEFPDFAALWRDGQLCIARKLQPECAAPDHDAQFYNVKSRRMPKTLSKRVYLASWQKSQSGQEETVEQFQKKCPKGFEATETTFTDAELLVPLFALTAEDRIPERVATAIAVKLKAFESQKKHAKKRSKVDSAKSR